MINFAFNPIEHQKFLREIFFETKVEINSLETIIKRGIDRPIILENLKAWQVNDLMKVNLFWWLSISNENSPKEAKKEYQFGALLTSEEKLWLETEITKRIAIENQDCFW